MTQSISLVALLALVHYSPGFAKQVQITLKKSVCNNHQNEVSRYRNSSSVIQDGYLFYGMYGSITKGRGKELKYYLDLDNIYVPTVTPERDIVVFDQILGATPNCEEFFLLPVIALDSINPLIHVYGSRKYGILAVYNVRDSKILFLYTGNMKAKTYEISNYIQKLNFSMLLFGSEKISRINLRNPTKGTNTF